MSQTASRTFRTPRTTSGEMRLPCGRAAQDYRRYLDAAASMNWYEISEERFERRARPVINIARPCNV